MPDSASKGRRAADTLDITAEKLVGLLKEKFTQRASGRYGVVVVLDNGFPTRIVTIKEETERLIN